MVCTETGFCCIFTFCYVTWLWGRLVLQELLQLEEGEPCGASPCSAGGDLGEEQLLPAQLRSSERSCLLRGCRFSPVARGCCSRACPCLSVALGSLSYGLLSSPLPCRSRGAPGLPSVCFFQGCQGCSWLYH